MKYLIIVLVGFALVAASGVTLLFSRTSETNRSIDTPSTTGRSEDLQLACQEREAVLSEQIGREVLDDGNFGGYLTTSPFLVTEGEFVEVVVVDNQQGGIFTNWQPSILLVVDGLEPDRKTDSRLPGVDDNGATIMTVEPGTYRAYTTANGAVIQVNICKGGA